MTSPIEVPVKKPKLFKVALIAAAVSPLSILLLALVVYLVTPEGPDALTGALLLLTLLILVGPVWVILLAVVGVTRVVSNRLALRRARRAAMQQVDETQWSSPHAGSALWGWAGSWLVRTIYAAVVFVAALPLLVILFGAMATLFYVLQVHVTTPDQNRDEVKARMVASLADAGYESLPGYTAAPNKLAVGGEEIAFGTTRYTASVSLRYTDAKAAVVARQRLEGRGWTCYSAATAPVAQAQALAATGSELPSASCFKSGRDVLTFTYAYPTLVMLEASSGTQVSAIEAPSDDSWCKRYGEMQQGELHKSCSIILGEDEETEAGKFGLSSKCYAEIKATGGFDTATTKVTRRCLEEYEQAYKNAEALRAAAH